MADFPRLPHIQPDFLGTAENSEGPHEYKIERCNQTEQAALLMRLYLTNDNVLRKPEEIGQLKNLVLQMPGVIPSH